MDWLLHQFSDFNVIQFISILFFVTTFQKSNTTKLLDKQTQEIHQETQEIKEEIRWRQNGS
jgi:hypothetical protein